MAVELKDFVGNTYTLTAASTGEVAGAGHDKDCIAETITFTLDGKHYMAMEDPSDGYRSSLKDIVEVTPGPKNTFQPQRVVCEVGSDSELIVFKSELTGSIIIEVGTDNSDDYYPRFVSHFSPNHMDINQPELVAAALAEKKNHHEAEIEKERLLRERDKHLQAVRGDEWASW